MVKPLLHRAGAVLIAMAFLTACSGEGESAETKSAERKKTVSATESKSSSSAADGDAETLAKLGFGDAKIRIIGTASKSGAGTEYKGDCDFADPDDDFEIISFSAPWTKVGWSGGGSPANLGGSRSIDFEKSPQLARKRFSLRFDLEKTDPSVSDLIAGYPVISEIPYGGETVKIIYAEKTETLVIGYSAFFPIAQMANVIPAVGNTGRYIAHLQFGPIGPHHFDGWDESEIVALFKSVYTERCIAGSFDRFFGALKPEITYD